MRELKFRAWDGFKMRNDFEVEANSGMIIEWVEVIIAGSLRYVPEDRGWKLMQYTGLKDKNGKEIYEGDILKIDDKQKNVSVVRFGKYVFSGDEYTEHGIGFYLDYYSGGKCQDPINGYYNCPSVYDEVIGNIYENPELLEVGQ